MSVRLAPLARFLELYSDGQIVRTEIEAGQCQAAKTEAFRKYRTIFDQLDADQSGQLSAAEFVAHANPDAIAASAAPLIEQSDANGD